DMVYVANAGCCHNLGRSVTVIAGATGSVVANVDLGPKSNPNTLTVDEATNKIYVADICSGEARTQSDCLADVGHTVSVIDGAHNTVVDQATVGPAPFGLTADSERNTVYVPNLFSNTVSV